MNRELKFRVWYPTEWDETGDKPIKFDMSYDWAFEEWAPINDLLKNSMPNDSIIMQYTGMNDKNGKEIYEGDIVMLVEANRLYTVEWLEYTFKLVHADPKLNRMHWGSIGRVNELIFTVEVVGNVFENRELFTRAVGV